MIGCAVGAGAMLLAWARLRALSRHRIEEALPECRIAELEPGRFRVIGRVVPIQTTPSGVDGADCVYLERAEYRSVGTGFVPLLREIEHAAVCHPFYLEDESGQLFVDPATTLIECARVTTDGGLSAERRLRAGEEVSLDAVFAPGDGGMDHHEGPYRANARRWTALADTNDPPRLSHRTERDMIGAPLDDVSGFLGGAGAIMMAMGILLAFVMGLVS